PFNVANPLTNTWYKGTTNGPGNALARDNGVPTAAVTNFTFGATNGTTNLVVANVQPPGTNYIAVWTDQAGSVTGLVSIIEVIGGPGTVGTNAGATFTGLAVSPTGNRPPTSFQWKRNGSNLANGTKYAGVTTANLIITNITPNDAGLYSNLVANADGSVIAV